MSTYLIGADEPGHPYQQAKRLAAEPKHRIEHVQTAQDLVMLLPGEKANAWAVGFVRGRHDHELLRSPVSVRPDVPLEQHTWIPVEDWAQVAPWCLGDDARRDTVTDTFTGTLRWERSR